MTAEAAEWLADHETDSVIVTCYGRSGVAHCTEARARKWRLALEHALAPPLHARVARGFDGHWTFGVVTHTEPDEWVYAQREGSPASVFEAWPSELTVIGGDR